MTTRRNTRRTTRRSTTTQKRITIESTTAEKTASGAEEDSDADQDSGTTYKQAGGKRFKVYGKVAHGAHHKPGKLDVESGQSDNDLPVGDRQRAAVSQVAKRKVPARASFRRKSDNSAAKQTKLAFINEGRTAH